MGTRGNIKVISGRSTVYLYQHYDADNLPYKLQSALLRAKAGCRLSDGQYLGRMIFSEMIQENIMGATGYGISSDLHDGDDRVLTVDVDNQTIQYNKTYEKIPFSVFISMETLPYLSSDYDDDY